MRYFNRLDMPTPKYLASKDAEEHRAAVMDYIASVYSRGGQRRAPDHRPFFSDPALRRDVRTAFRGRCAYCERACRDDGLIHHHRPPGLAATAKGETELLNYVWLTYDWENLYWVCPSCASRKANRFFARNPTRETGADLQALRLAEGELLLDPCFHDPDQHLDFRPDGTVIARTPEGVETIRLLDLDADEMREMRKDAGRRLLDLVREPSRANAWATGLVVGAGNAVFSSDRVLVSNTTTPMIGAASLALIHWARGQGVAAPDARGLIEALLDMGRGRTQDMMNAYAAEIDRPPGAMESAGAMPEADGGAEMAGQLDAIPPAEAPLAAIAIRNFKALRAIDLRLPPEDSAEPGVPCAVILGENATGKSSVLEAVALALLGTDENAALNRTLGGDELAPLVLQHRPDPENWDVLSPDPLQIDIAYAGYDQGTHLQAASGARAFEGPAAPSKILLAYGPRRYFAKRKTRRFRAPRHRVRSLFDPLMTIQNPVDWLLRCADKPFDAAVRALREVLMLDDDDQVLRDGAKGRILIDTTQGRTPLSSLSEGYKSVVAMAVDITRELLNHYDNLENAHAVVLIDEIETHLHPRWKMQIMERLRRAFPCVQFLVTTHDPLCLRGMRKGEVFVLQRDPENRRVESLSDLPDVRGLRAEQLLTSEFFGLGSTDPATEAKIRRYEVLTLHPMGTAAEAAELDRLREEIALTSGNSIQEQLLNEAFAKAGIDPFAAMPKVNRQDRAGLVERLRQAVTTGTQAVVAAPDATARGGGASESEGEA